jgi:hypothetical protein
MFRPDGAEPNDGALPNHEDFSIHHHASPLGASSLVFVKD